MPFDPRGLTSLASTDSFTLWLYVTTDTRAAVLAPGYFTAATGRLQPGHVVVLQSADSLTFLPVRSSATVGNGLVLDASAAPLRLNANAELVLDIAMAAVAAATRTVALGTIPTGLYTGRSFTVSASVSGPVSTLVFSMLNASGTVVLGPTSVAVSSGGASVSFTAPAAGSGYRIRVADADEPLATQTSASIVVTEPYALLTEAGTSLLASDGGEILL
ncbi:hypothetical protein NON00_07635 [Roseomonas sp. GC11]|uniref:hypothetical protein n=1 Tax=Roseomonas sp. GC11 TaxID=2950546 RepID=UPI00210C7EA0|nr:hypothetical protein [Roseomonas sp. GC11]MCQ4159798.1 hypothetical protein [Roseomonas sp. GC11]